LVVWIWLSQLKSILLKQYVRWRSWWFFFRSVGGGAFEIRTRLDLGIVFDKDNKPMIYYAKDLYAINKEREAKGLSEIEQEVKKSQERKIEAKKLNKEYFPSGGF